jgi:hypothetical protein
VIPGHAKIENLYCSEVVLRVQCASPAHSELNGRMAGSHFGVSDSEGLSGVLRTWLVEVFSG